MDITIVGETPQPIDSAYRALAGEHRRGRGCCRFEKAATRGQEVVEMKRFAGLIVLALTVAVVSPSAAFAQMMQGGIMMGGGTHGMINLVSPADSPTQIQRGTLMIGSYMFGMMGQPSMGPGGPAPTAGGTRGVRLVLRLFGVSDANGPVTSTNNHLIFRGELTTPTGNRAPLNIDQVFALTGGSALIQVPVSMSTVTGSATITMDLLAVQNAAGDAFAVPGISLGRPIAQFTPAPTPTTGCQRDSDCDDGNPNTRDVCMPMGCSHTGMGIGMH